MWCRLWLLLLLLSPLCGGGAAAQSRVEVHGDEQTPLGGAFDPSRFRTLVGEPDCAVRYRDALDRAHHVLRRLEVMGYHFRRWSRGAVPMAVWLADRALWRESGLQIAYGLPARVGGSAILVPAEGDAGTVALWRGVLGSDGLPSLPGSPLVGTRSEVATLVLADDLLQLEAARGFVPRAGLAGDEAWIAELAAHVVAQSLLRRYEKDRVASAASFFARLEERFAPGGALAGFGPRLLASGQQADLESWLWYQGRFAAAARLVLERGGGDTVEWLLKTSRQARGVLRRDQLLRRFPELGGWLDSFPPEVSR